MKRSGSTRASRRRSTGQHRARAVLWVVAASAVAVGVVVGTIESLESSVRAEIQHKELDVPSSVLEEVRREEDARLFGYVWMDQAQGSLRVPLDRARELTLSAYARASADAGVRTTSSSGSSR